VLIVYNATILAILVLLTIVVSGPVKERSALHHAVLRYAVMALGGLTLLLNVYALIAIRSDPWVDIFRESIGRVSLLAVAWGLWTIIGLPLAFD
jgi:hypothetical protein